MKSAFALALLSMVLWGCGVNPNKEARIQQLESDIEQTMRRADSLEARVQALEGENQQLESRIKKFERERPDGA